jgi:hypothetical protein
MARNTTEFTSFVTDAQEQALAWMKETQDLSTRWLELVASSLPKASTAKPAIEAAFSVAAQALSLQKAYALALAGAFGESKSAS